MRNPTAGHGQGRSIDRDPLDPFVQDYLSDRLMYMEPRDGMLVNPEQNWMLADAENRTVLLYSLSGPEIILQQKLRKQKFQGVWFDPGTGKTMPAKLPERLKKGTSISKPTAENWLFLLRADNSF